MALTATQRAVLEQAIRRTEQGPSLDTIGSRTPGMLTVEEAQNRARIWAQSWIGDALKAMVEHDEGKINNWQLAEWGR